MISQQIIPSLEGRSLILSDNAHDLIPMGLKEGMVGGLSRRPRRRVHRSRTLCTQRPAR